MFRHIYYLIAIVASAGSVTAWGGEAAAQQGHADTPPGMTWVAGGDFTMGSDRDEAWANERPAHRVHVDGFFIDLTEVTNAQFGQFVDSTKYVTGAEKTPKLEDIIAQLPPGSPPPPKEMLVPGSLVFIAPQADEKDADWWHYVLGADWRHPSGPGSSIVGMQDHPVVHVSWDDAQAYAKWARKRLPSEAEWEYAARGGLEGKRFGWGDELPSEEHPPANIWQGEFPTHNTKKDGYEFTAPVKSFPSNGYGLYDMAGNVWEWCGDWYAVDAYRAYEKGSITNNPKGPATFNDPEEPGVPKRVMKGGSFLCHITYCESYRPSARRGESPDTGTAHLGFRCVKTLE